jgi:hypothetical protein
MSEAWQQACYLWLQGKGPPPGPLPVQAPPIQALPLEDQLIETTEHIIWQKACNLWRAGLGSNPGPPPLPIYQSITSDIIDNMDAISAIILLAHWKINTKTTHSLTWKLGVFSGGACFAEISCGNKDFSEITADSFLEAAEMVIAQANKFLETLNG